MHRFGEVSVQRTLSNLLYLHPHRDSKVASVLLHEVGVVRLYRTFCDYIYGGCRVHEVRVQADRTSSNLLERHPHRDGEVERVLLHEVGVTFRKEPSLPASLQGMEGVQGAICTRWMRLTQIEPPRTLANCILTEIALSKAFFHTSSEWFVCTKPC